MAQKWNLQDIKPAEPRRRPIAPAPEQMIRRPQPQPIEPEIDEDIGTITIEDGNKKSRRALMYPVAVFLLIIAGGVFASILMGGAEVTVNPKHREPNVNAVFEAHKSATADQLPYELMTLEAEGEQQVQATGKETVEAQATGKILIYNKHATTPVRLVTNTRFSTAEGLIFRIKDAAVIPGYTKDDAGNIVPGMVSAEVFADEVGEKYNIEPTRFTIPGFQGEPEYDNLYAESTEVFSGGFSGDRFIIAEAEMQTAEQALRTQLRNSLLERINAEKPAGFVVFTDAVTFTYVSLPAVAYGDNLATIKEKVIMRIPIFKEEQFASYLAAATIPEYEKEPVRIADTGVLTFSYTNATTSASDIGAVGSLSFKLTGRPQIIWEYDAAKLKADLLNVNKSALTSVLGGYPAITKAEAEIRPFWKTKFPIQIDDIEVIEVIEE